MIVSINKKRRSFTYTVDDGNVQVNSFTECYDVIFSGSLLFQLIMNVGNIKNASLKSRRSVTKHPGLKLIYDEVCVVALLKGFFPREDENRERHISYLAYEWYKRKNTRFLLRV